MLSEDLLDVVVSYLVATRPLATTCRMWYQRYCFWHTSMALLGTSRLSLSVHHHHAARQIPSTVIHTK